MSDAMIQALRSADAYPHPADPVECIETHISWVLLAGDTVYKIKKPLDLGFLDFTGLDARRHFCEEEIRLNRRTAPDIYRGVSAVTGSRQRPRIDGPGPIVEYAVRMRRFDSSDGFDRLLERGALTRDNVVDLARQLARLHDIADVADPDGDYGTFEQVAEPMRDNFDVLAERGDGGSDDRVERLREWSDERLRALTESIRQRLADGRVRECHGDAHLGNVVLIDGRATLFDCIEFSPELRWIDVVNDIAFTVMDLRDRGAPGLSWAALDAYLTESGDFSGLPLLPLYMVYRALVRAKVQTLAREQADDGERRRQLAREIDGYIDLAGTIAADHRPGIIVTRGLSGSGKSWLARRVVERIGVVRVRSDVERKRLHGLRPEESSASGLGTRIYSTDATNKTYAHLSDVARSVVESGLPVLIDATCLKSWQRDGFRSLASDLGVPFGIIDCRAPTDVLEERIRERGDAGGDPSEAGIEVLHAQLESAEALTPSERALAVAVDTRRDAQVESCMESVRSWLDGGAESVQPD